MLYFAKGQDPIQHEVAYSTSSEWASESDGSHSEIIRVSEEGTVTRLECRGGEFRVPTPVEIHAHGGRKHA